MAQDGAQDIVESVLRATELRPAEALEYDEFVRGAAAGHYSQSRSWARVVASAGRARPWFFLAKRNANVVGAGVLWQPLLLGRLPLPVAYMERGPVCNNLDDLSLTARAAQIQARRRGLLRISLMPYWSDNDARNAESILTKLGFRNVQTDDGRHICSLRMNLRDRSVLNLEGRALSKLRMSVARAQRAGVTVRHGHAADFKAFQELNDCMQRRERKRVMPQKWYAALADFIATNDQTSSMFVCEHQGRVISAVVVICQGSTATYVTGASTTEQLRFPKMACALVEAIRWAAAAGMTTFDLGGVPRPGDQDERRANIAQFKSIFSGETVTFVPEMARWA